MPAQSFDPFADAQEVVIETTAGDRTYKTIIWVAPGNDTLYVRSYLGDEGKWYQRVLANPEIVLVAGGSRVAFRAVPATDDKSIEQASAGFRAKYREGPSLDAMVRPDVLQTTLRLDPIE